MKDLIPSTKADRYVSSALNLRTFFRKVAASVMFFPRAMFSSISKLILLVVNPCALIHLTLGAENFRPANSAVGLNRYPKPSQEAHLVERENGAPSFLVFLTLPVP